MHDAIVIRSMQAHVEERARELLESYLEDHGCTGYGGIGYGSDDSEKAKDRHRLEIGRGSRLVIARQVGSETERLPGMKKVVEQSLINLPKAVSHEPIPTSTANCVDHSHSPRMQFLEKTN